jgi:hypothetical protein
LKNIPSSEGVFTIFSAFQFTLENRGVFLKKWQCVEGAFLLLTCDLKKFNKYVHQLQNYLISIWPNLPISMFSWTSNIFLSWEKYGRKDENFTLLERYKT